MNLETKFVLKRRGIVPYWRLETDIFFIKRQRKKLENINKKAMFILKKCWNPNSNGCMSLRSSMFRYH